MTFAWRPGSLYDVAATRGADSVLASDCRAHFGRPSTRMSHLCDSTVASPTARRDNVLAWPPLQSLAVKKNSFLCTFWAVKNF